MWVVIVWCALLYFVILGSFITNELKEGDRRDTKEEENECEMAAEEIEPEVC